MKKLLSFTLALALCLCLTAPALAYDASRAGETPTLSIDSRGIYASVAEGFVDANGSLWMRREESGTWAQETANGSFVKVMDGVRSISFGGYTPIAVKTDGSLWVLEYDTTESVYVPVWIMEDVIAVSSGLDYFNIGFNAAIKTDGSLWTWGGNISGQLGNGTTEDSSVPIRVMEDVVAVSCGGRHAAAIKADGSLWTWGGNYSGQLGIDMSIDYQTLPIKVMDGVIAVNCNDSNTAVITKDDSLWIWGSNLNGQLGNGQGGYLTGFSTPAKVLDNVASVSCGSSSVAAVTTDGSLWTWGGNLNGQLGNNYTGDANNQNGQPFQLWPAKVMEDVAFAVCGIYSLYIVKTDGSVWGCGASRYIGDLSDMTNVDGSPIQSVPIPIPELTSFKVKLSSPASAPLIASGISVAVNDAAVKWTDAKPFIDANNRTMVPLRAVADAMGLEVNWDNDAREASFTNGSKTIWFPIDSSTARTSEGGAVTMDTAAVIVKDRTYAPIRYLAEFFGYHVDWDQDTQTVNIA